LRKFLYSFLIFVILLIVTIVVAANSSYVIKRVVDIFAPDYHISYNDIKGNIFTGVNIAGLKFDNKEIIENIRFSWNPSKILYGRVAINEINGEGLDVNVTKELIASFPKSAEDNTSSTSLPVTITIDKAHLTVKPFKEQGIAFQKAEVDAKDITYASDEIEAGSLFVRLDSSLTNLVLRASLTNGKATVSELGVENIDSEMIEHLLLSKKNNESESDTNKKAVSAEKEEINPLIPKEVLVENFRASLKPRSYKDAAIDKLEMTVRQADVDLVKVLGNKKDAVNVGKYTLDFQSDVGQIKVKGDLKNDVLTLDDVNASKIDTLALQKMFVSNSIESNTSDVNETVDTTVLPEEENSTKSKKVNHLIPKYAVINAFHTDVLPATYDPVHVIKLALDIQNIKLNINDLLVENASIGLQGVTNLSNFKESGNIKNNHFMGTLKLTPHKRLFELYKLPLRKEAIGDIIIDLNASGKQVVADVNSRAKNIFISQKNDTNNSDSNVSKEFNVDIDNFISHEVYIIKENRLNADTKIMITTPYAKDISMSNTFVMDKGMHYEGVLKIGKVFGLNGKTVPPLNNLNVHYDGTLKNVNTILSSDGLKGSFISKDMKKGHLLLKSTQAINVGRIVTLPAELNATKVKIDVDVPLDFENMDSIKGKAKLTSNVVNVDADIFYGKQVKVIAKSVIPKDSLLINFDKNIHFSAISPMVTTFKMGKKDLALTAKSSKISADVLMKPDEKTVDGKINLAGLVSTLNAKPNGNIAIQSDVGSFATLLTTIQQFYTVEDMPKVDGKLDISMLIKKNKDATLTITSPKVIYHTDRKTDHDINDLKIVVAKQGEKILLNNYTLSYDKMKVFATKPSEINFKNDDLVINQLWLNDQLKVTGQLDTETMKGQIFADAINFHLAHEMADLDSAINIETVLDGNSTDIKGKVILLGGNIHYDLTTKTFPSDSDIVIMQETKKKKENPFMDHLSMAVNVDTKKPLVFKKSSINVQAKVQMGIHKAIYSDPMIIGSVDLVDGGYYIFQGKKFVLKNSHIYFTGDPEKPMLDITAKYRTIKNTLITINITGTPAVPNILFSSAPSLSKEQILSVILFDSEEGAGTNSGDDMMKMMGGAMAKSALSNLGVKLDHLVIGEGNSVEVGKKITDKTTVIYINGDIPEIKVKYDYSPSIEGVIGASERSQSAEVVYKKDFSADDIVIKGR